MIKPVTVYIASPYTVGDVGHNVREPFFLAEELITMGFLPYLPLTSHLWQLISPHSKEYWMNLDEKWILKCDCLFRMEGFSKGADEEVVFAEKHNIPVFCSLDTMIDWRNLC